MVQGTGRMLDGGGRGRGRKAAGRGGRAARGRGEACKESWQRREACVRDRAQWGHPARAVLSGTAAAAERRREQGGSVAAARMKLGLVACA